MLKKIKMFYLLNYKGVHHTFNLFSFFVVFYLLEIHQLLIPSKGPMLFQLFILLINFMWTEFTIKLINFNNLIEEELKKMNEHKKK